MNHEIWESILYRNIKPGMYEASSLGRIRNTSTGHVMSQCLSEKGYPMTLFRCSDNRSRTMKTHRIIATVFIEQKNDERDEVNHIDGDKSNNQIDNLEWVTRKENIRHGFNTGLIPALKGSLNGNTNLSDDDVHYVCLMLLEYDGDCQKIHLVLFKNMYYHITLSQIRGIKYKKCWSHISDKYFNDNTFIKPVYLTPKIVEYICELLVKHKGVVNDVIIELRTGNIDVSSGKIHHIKQKNSWKHISDKYFKRL